MTLLDIDAATGVAMGLLGTLLVAAWPAGVLIGEMRHVRRARARHIARRRPPRWRSVVPAMLAAALVGACGGTGIALRADAPYERCLSALRAEYDLWVQDASHEVDPPECDQPGVTYAEYARAWREAGGGDVWVAPPA